MILRKGINKQIEKAGVEMENMCLFILGATVESFIETVAYRKIRQENYITGRSHCENCNHQLQWFELIPILSYLFLKGRCRCCQQSIAWYHPVLEVVGGCLVIGCHWRYGLTLDMVFITVICFDLLLIAYIDHATQLIYGSELLIFAVCTLFMRIQHGFQLTELLTAGMVSFIMMFMNLLVRDSFGFGDIEVMMISGFLLGGKLNIIAMMIAVLMAGLYCGCLLKRGKISRYGHIAFGPFMMAGIILTLFYGQELLMWWNFR